MKIKEHLSVYLESGYLFDDMSGKLKWFENDQPNVWLRIKNGRIETIKGIKVEQTEAKRLWGLIKVFHDGGQFKRDLVLDVNGHRWAFNRYENDILTAGCHLIAYSEMEGVARQLGWD